MRTAETADSTEPAATGPRSRSAEPFMSVVTGAAKLRRSKEYLYAGLREGRFPGLKFGRSWVLYADFVDGFIHDVVDRGLSTSFEDYAAEWLAKASEGAA